MKKSKKERLEKNGWKVGDIDEYLDLSKAEMDAVEKKAATTEKFDYVDWRKKSFEGETLESFLDKAAEYSKEHPLKDRK